MSQRNARFLACLALSIIALSLPCYALDGIGVSRRAENDDDKLYRRRSLHDAVIIGDYLYIEGGEISLLEDERASHGGLRSTAVNNTLSIPLNKSWTNSTVKIDVVEHYSSMPTRNNAILWPDSSNNAAYRWGGDGSYGAIVDHSSTKLWALSSNGQGGSSWSPKDPVNLGVFDQIYAGVGGASATCDRTSYYVGGFGTKASDIRLSDTVFGKSGLSLPGVLSYEMDALTWSNDSTAGLNDHGVSKYQKAACVDGGSRTSSLLLMGGQMTGQSSALDSASSYSSFQNITIYNPVDKTWHYQQTTGDAPPAKQFFCALTSRSMNSTYEIFVYGGVTAKNVGFGSMHILSIPAFHWFSVDVETDPRVGHACVTNGNGQMIVVGGTDAASSWAKFDPWANGLGVFDMVDLEWKNQYDSGGRDYDSPQMVKDYYRINGRNNTAWTTPEVESLFPDLLNPDNPGDSSDSDSNKSRAGPIAGGVVGGVVLFGLVAFAIFFLLRRRRRAKANTTTQPSDYQSPTYSGPHMLQNHSVAKGPQETQQDSDFRQELSGKGVPKYEPLSQYETPIPQQQQQHQGQWVQGELQGEEALHHQVHEVPGNSMDPYSSSAR